MKTTLLILCLWAAAANAAITWYSPKPGIYLAQGSCGKIVVIQTKAGKFLWRTGQRKRGLVATLDAAQTAAGVCK